MAQSPQSRPATGSQNSQEELSLPRGSARDPILAMMRRLGIPLTREKYLAIAYPEGLPKEWGAELEAQLPLEIQKSSGRMS